MLVRESVQRLMESNSWYDYEPLCRLPYIVSIQFSDHAIAREYERELSEDEIVDDARAVVKELIQDFKDGVIRDGTKFRIVNTETCVVAVGVVKANYGGTRIHRINIITAYIWDGRYNLKGLKHYFPTDQESPRWREAAQWNKENQGKIEAFTDWKHDVDLEKLMRKADWEYGKRNPYYTPDHETLMKRMNMTYDNREKDVAKNKEKYDGLYKKDYDSIKDYEHRFDKEHIVLKPLQKMVHSAVKQALREHLTQKTSKNTSRKKVR